MPIFFRTKTSHFSPTSLPPPPPFEKRTRTNDAWYRFFSFLRLFRVCTWRGNLHIHCTVYVQVSTQHVPRALLPCARASTQWRCRFCEPMPWPYGSRRYAFRMASRLHACNDLILCTWPLHAVYMCTTGSRSTLISANELFSFLKLILIITDDPLLENYSPCHTRIHATLLWSLKIHATVYVCLCDH